MTLIGDYQPGARQPQMPPRVPLAEPLLWTGELWWQAIDQFGVEWYCESLAGWSGTPLSDAPAIRRGQEHGVWSVDGWYGGRRITFTGTIVAPSATQLRQAIDRLTEMHALALREGVELGVVEVDATKTLAVRASGPALGVEHIGHDVARVTFELLAPWPIKAGPLQSASIKLVRGAGWTYPRLEAERPYAAPPGAQDLIVTLNGNAPCKPRFLITGPVNTPRVMRVEPMAPIYNNPELAFLINIPDANWQLAADAATHSVGYGTFSSGPQGNYHYVLSARSTWFDLLPGQNTIRFSAGSSHVGQLIVQWHDSWW